MNVREIKKICRYYAIENYTINPDGSIDVYEDVWLSNKDLTELPLTFNKVTGNFWCQNNKLTTLKGSPKEVGGDFSYYSNNLSNLEFCPKIVGGSFSCGGNKKLTSLKGCPEKIGKDFNCSWTSLTNLKYIPDCDTLYCYGCPIPLFEYRYIFMHKVNKIAASDDEYNEILNRLLKEDKTIPEKIQELQKYVN